MNEIIVLAFESELKKIASMEKVSVDLLRSYGKIIRAGNSPHAPFPKKTPEDLDVREHVKAHLVGVPEAHKRIEVARQRAMDAVSRIPHTERGGMTPTEAGNLSASTRRIDQITRTKGLFNQIKEILKTRGSDKQRPEPKSRGSSAVAEMFA